MKSTLFTVALLLPLAVANAATTDRYIRGAADPSAQIVVTNENTGAVMGYVATGNGHYEAGPLLPGRYSIVEKLPHHATRHLELKSDKDGEVDL